MGSGGSTQQKCSPSYGKGSVKGSMTTDAERAWERYHTQSVLMYEAKEALEGRACQEPCGIRRKMRQKANALKAHLSLGCGCVQFDESMDARMSDSDSFSARKQRLRMEQWVQGILPPVLDISVNSASLATSCTLPCPTPSETSLSDAESFHSGDEDEAHPDIHGKHLTPLNAYVLKHHNSMLLGSEKAQGLDCSLRTSVRGQSSPYAAAQLKGSLRQSLGDSRGSGAPPTRLEGSSDSDLVVEDVPLPEVTLPNTTVPVAVEAEEGGVKGGVVELPPVGSISSMPPRPGLAKSESFRVGKGRGSTQSQGTLAAALKQALAEGSHAPLPTPPPKA